MTGSLSFNQHAHGPQDLHIIIATHTLIHTFSDLRYLWWRGWVCCTTHIHWTTHSLTYATNDGEAEYAAPHTYTDPHILWPTRPMMEAEYAAPHTYTELHTLWPTLPMVERLSMLHHTHTLNYTLSDLCNCPPAGGVQHWQDWHTDIYVYIHTYTYVSITVIKKRGWACCSPHTHTLSHTLSDLYNCPHHAQTCCLTDTHSLTYMTVSIMVRFSMLMTHTHTDLYNCPHDGQVDHAVWQTHMLTYITIPMMDRLSMLYHTHTHWPM